MHRRIESPGGRQAAWRERLRHDSGYDAAKCELSGRKLSDTSQKGDTGGLELGSEAGWTAIWHFCQSWQLAGRQPANRTGRFVIKNSRRSF
jgi:hypothetical protein